MWMFLAKSAETYTVGPQKSGYLESKFFKNPKKTSAMKMMLQPFQLLSNFYETQHRKYTTVII